MPIHLPAVASGVTGYECRHVTYCESLDGRSDMHVAKEYIHYADGSRQPNIRLFVDMPREFWVTREGFRKHQDKKEYEEMSRLQRYECPQFELNDRISRALYSRPAGSLNFRKIATSPYLYGCDIATTSLLKKRYETTWPELITPRAEVAVLDIETDVLNGSGDIILVTLSFKSRVVTAINRSFLSDTGNTVEKLHQMAAKCLGEKMEKRKIKWEIAFFDTPGQCAAHVMTRAHEWSPDFITIWNMDFDLPKITGALTAEGYNLSDVFSHPSVPEKYRFYRYIQGKAQKVTQSGKIMPLHPADRWHIAECPAGFYFIDAMCLYKRVRIAKGMEPSYALDAILRKHGLSGKLSIPEIEHLDGLKWHIAAQRDYRLEYVVYNVDDCIEVEELDERTGDVASTFPILCGNSDFRNFTSNPRRIVDDMHYYYLEENCVIGTTGQDLQTDDDELVVGMNEWIVTLPAHLVDDNGIALIREMPELRSMARVHLADLDIAGTYPTEEEVFNISKETTYRELSQIEGLSESERRSIGINMSGGVVNAIEICSTAFSLPTPDMWLELYDQAQHLPALERTA